VRGFAHCREVSDYGVMGARRLVAKAVFMPVTENGELANIRMGTLISAGTTVDIMNLTTTLRRCPISPSARPLNSLAVVERGERQGPGREALDCPDFEKYMGAKTQLQAIAKA
jgi:hypothetical protein